MGQIVRVPGAPTILQAIRRAGQEVLVSGVPDPILDFTGWWRASYAGSPWSSSPSGGTSGSAAALAEATNPPAVGAAVNGFDPASFNGTSSLLSTGTDFSTFVTANAGSILVLFNAASAAVADAQTYNDPALVSDKNFGFNLGFSDGGLGIGFFAGGWVENRVACSTLAWHLGMCRWDGAQVEISVDGALPSSTAAGAKSFFAGATFTAGHAQISVSSFFNGSILEIVSMDTTISDADLVTYIAYVNARYGLAI